MIYCYETSDGEIIELNFPVGTAPKSVMVGKQRVFRSFSAEHKSVPPTTGWPITCFASGVNAAQAPELREHYRKHGVNVEVTSDGDPVYKNAQQRRKALKCRNMVDRSSYV